jgi:hypothetical protein
MNRRSLILLPAVALAGCKLISKTEKADKDAKAQPVDRSEELQIAYAIEVETDGKPKRVREDETFRSGDGFRFIFKPDFKAYVYVLNRGPHEKAYQILFPNSKISIDNPIEPKKEVAIPGGETWLRMDNRKGDEDLVLIASNVQLPDFNTTEKTIDRDTFDERIAHVERRYRPKSSRRFGDGDWVKVFAAGAKQDVAMVLRVPLRHE